jgi:hypothetical protein
VLCETRSDAGVGEAASWDAVATASVAEESSVAHGEVVAGRAQGGNTGGGASTGGAWAICGEGGGDAADATTSRDTSTGESGAHDGGEESFSREAASSAGDKAGAATSRSTSTDASGAHDGGEEGFSGEAASSAGDAAGAASGVGSEGARPPPSVDCGDSPNSEHSAESCSGGGSGVGVV